ncbi:MAG: FixH family protein [Elainellaceae cyanobacterium]
MKKRLFLLIAVGFLAACGGTNQAEGDAADTATAPAADAASPASGEVDIALVSPDDGTVPMGDAALVLQVVDPATNEPVAVDGLQVDLSMAMDGMEPMTTMAVVEPGEQPGQYNVMTDMGMAGMWTMAVESSDPAMPGEATFDIEVK